MTLRRVACAVALALAWIPGGPARGQEPGPAAGARRVEDFAPEDEFVMVGPVKTHFVRRGEAGRPVVLVHGFGSSTYTWRRNLDELARQFRVYAVDLRGFGLTAKPRDGRYAPSELAGHLLEFLDAMGLRHERPVLVGSSMGGAVALELALRHPGRVGGLVLVDSARPGWRPSADLLPGARPGAAAAGRPSLPREIRAALVRAMITPALVESMLRTSYHDPALVTPEMIETYHRVITIDGAAEALIAMTEPSAPAEPLPPMGSLRAPVLIIWGRHDRDLPPRLADELAAELPGATAVLFEGSAHLPHEEEPVRFNALVTGFVLGIGAADLRTGRGAPTQDPAPREDE